MSAPRPKVVRILGTRGVPARHGGFETFAEALSLHLAGRGWSPVVYCQVDGAGGIATDRWRGVERVLVGTRRSGAAATVEFDWRALRHAARSGDLLLTLGYNTAVLNWLLRGRSGPGVINMDGLEWRRAKWNAVERLWLRLNERAAVRGADMLVADHPAILAHLSRFAPGERLAMLPYPAPLVTAAPKDALAPFGLTRGGYALIVARPEPENSILEMVRAWSHRPRGRRLLVVGKLDQAHPYHRAVRAAAGDEVDFAGAVHDRATLQALRVHARVYLHGHQVGGTNPSLVEALGCGSPVLARDNRFNRWTAGPGAAFFADEAALEGELAPLLADDARLAAMRRAAYARHAEAFTEAEVLGGWESLLEGWLP